MTTSASAIVELSRSKKRYHDQDCLLAGFVGFAGCTAKEIAVEVLDWRYEQYANAPKRAFDLDKLGYLEALENRECRQTGKVAHTYRITDKGIEHLRKVGMGKRAPVAAAADQPVVVVSVESGRKHFTELKSLLGA